MLATGGSASKAIDILKERGVPEDAIIFVNLVASRYGLQTVLDQFPGLRIVTAAVDDDLTASKYVRSRRDLRGRMLTRWQPHCSGIG